MPISPRTNRSDPSPVRGRIIEAALTLFAEHGYDGVAVPSVARRAQVGTGSIYRYFDDKVALVNAVFQYAKQKLQRYFEESIDLQAPPRDCFHQFWWTLSRFAEQAPEAFRFLEMQDHRPYLSPESRALERHVLFPLLQLCRNAQQQGLARTMDAPALMAMIWGAFVGLHKAADLGFLSLTTDTEQAAERACWAMITGLEDQAP
ncbi:TetR/AcrR family transcriptional regulator [Marinobacteraceae bacterium S3BR75-40.1]